MSKVVIHIGLHKTATRFFQRALLSNLDRSRFLVNPPALMASLRRALRGRDPEAREQFVSAAHAALSEAQGRTLVVSDPDISGNMFRNQRDYVANLQLMRRAFPEATVLYFVRRHSDWLHSAYRQSLVKGRAAPIEVFLNFHDGAFREALAPRVNGARTIEALRLPFLEIYRSYAEAYGSESVYLFRQEDLRARPEAVYRRLAEALGLEQLPDLPARVSSNRAFSALALRLFFPCTRRMPDMSKAVLSHHPIRTNRFNLDRPLRKLRTLFVRHVFDRIVYRDWDLLAEHGMRKQIDAHYATAEAQLAAAADIVLERGPCPEALAAARIDSSPTES